MLELRRVHKVYQNGEMYVTALRDINLSFKTQEFVAILGPSGGGKTTLLNIIGGLDYYTQNDLFISGQSLTGYRRSDLIINGKSTKIFNDQDWDLYRSERVGFVFQGFNLLANLTVIENIELALTISGNFEENTKELALDALKRVGLNGYENHKNHQLSTGQKQRVAIARAIVKDPDIILADEPTGSLDAESRIEVMELINELAKDRLVIIVTHNEDLAYKYADRIIKLADGEVIEDSRPAAPTKDAIPYEHKNTFMSFKTSFKLAVKNLRSKLTKTLVGAVAGSIGIAGVALVMAISNGFGREISRIETETLSAMPIAITTAATSASSLPIFSGSGYIYNYSREFNPVPAYNTLTHSNVITPNYLDHLDNINPEWIDAIQYNYGVNMVFMKETNDTYINSFEENVRFKSLQSSLSYLRSQYTLEAGVYPSTPYEVVIIVDVFNNIDASILSFLGIENTRGVQFDDVIGREIRLALNDDMNIDYDPVNATFSRTLDGDTYDNGIVLTISGVLKGKSNGLETRTFGVFYQDTLEKMYVENSLNSDLCVFINNYDRTDFTLAQNQEFVRVRRLNGCNDLPIHINIYPASLNQKTNLLVYLNSYNRDLPDNEKIFYTDLAVTVTGVLSSISRNVTFILISLAGISLFVSLMMIGILIYVGLQERTKEIGILRSLGARKKDIAHIFNAETIIIGFLAAFIGITTALILSIPLNNFFDRTLDGFENIVTLRVVHALLITLLSISLTLFTGFFPSKVASKKHPARALKYNE
ncbi:MAG: ATP-binding cassette domain-containing protein [Candidatus Izemoplasmataceae bacterium]|jgi:putative ABC transport system permease protein